MLVEIELNNEALKSDFGEDKIFEILSVGVYQTFVYDFEKYVNHKIDRTPQLKSGNAYGLCDNFEQVVKSYPELQGNEGKYYIQVTDIHKKGLKKEKEIKYSSWGGYIGERKLKEEYFSLEPEIESITAFHIIEIKD